MRRSITGRNASICATSSTSDARGVREQVSRISIRMSKAWCAPWNEYVICSGAVLVPMGWGSGSRDSSSNWTASSRCLKSHSSSFRPVRSRLAERTPGFKGLEHSRWPTCVVLFPRYLRDRNYRLDGSIKRIYREGASHDRYHRERQLAAECAAPFASADQCRQPFYPDASRIFEESIDSVLMTPASATCSRRGPNSISTAPHRGVATRKGCQPLSEPTQAKVTSRPNAWASISFRIDHGGSCARLSGGDSQS